MAEKRRGRQLQVGSNVPVSIPDFASGSEPDPIRNPNRYISIDEVLQRSDGAAWSAVGGGATTFDELTDTPANKTNSGGKRAAVNDGEGGLIYADDATLALDVTSGNVAVTAVQFIVNFRYVPTAVLTVARTFTFPSGRPRVFQVQNPSGSGVNALTVAVGSMSIAVASGKERLFYTDGTTNGLVQLTDDAGGSFSGARVSLTTGEVIPTGATTEIVWDQEDVDDGGWVDVGVDGTFLRAPAGPTRAWAMVKVRFDTNVTGVRRVQLWQGTSGVAEPDVCRMDRDPASASAGGTDIIAESGVVDLANGRDFGVKVFQTSGGNLNIASGTSSFFCAYTLD